MSLASPLDRVWHLAAPVTTAAAVRAGAARHRCPRSPQRSTARRSAGTNVAVLGTAPGDPRPQEPVLLPLRLTRCRALPSLASHARGPRFCTRRGSCVASLAGSSLCHSPCATRALASLPWRVGCSLGFVCIALLGVGPSGACEEVRLSPAEGAQGQR